MGAADYTLPVQMTARLRDSLINLQRIRGKEMPEDMRNMDPIRKDGVPSKAEVIRQLIREAHSREVEKRG